MHEYQKELKICFGQALAKTKEQLKNNGFEILMEKEIKAALKEKFKAIINNL